ncbi:hypothetical protein ACFE04_013676 [Oxalis oulophora]
MAAEANASDESTLSIPPLDNVFLSTTTTTSSSSEVDHLNPNTNNNLSDLDFNFTFDDNCDLDFDFDFDDLYFPTETEHFIIPNTESEAATCDVHCDDAACGPVSSHESAANYPNSPDSSSEDYVVEQKVKLEEIGNGKVSYAAATKRKEIEGDCVIEEIMRTSKYRRSSSENASDVADSTDKEGMGGCVDDKRKARLIRNRESAQLSRQRKKHYVEELEDKVRSMHSTIADLNGKISYFIAENTALRQQLTGANAMCPPTAPIMYPPPPMGYHPWVPCAPYMVKQQGSQVPLVPIPRLKPHQPASAPKVKKTDTKKRSEGKTKKIASVTFLGLLFFMVLFGGLVPIVDVTFGGISTGGSGVFGSGFYDQHRGRVLRVDSFSNGTDKSTGSDGKCPNSGPEVKSKHSSGSDEFDRVGNASEPLVASLYVPRNDKLVKIDGNLIIHSVLASEKARAFQRPSGKENNSETGLAIPKHPAIGRHPHMYRNPSERPKALASDKLKDHMKSSAADGKMQQWFREGIAGPMLSSGMCTEVFQFDTSSASASGAIIPASSVSKRENDTQTNKGKRKRILRGLPIPLPGSNVNFTGEQAKRDNFTGNASASSVVVSVLVDPREVGDSDMVTPKSLSRIFVVVLMDSVKYVTYSCMLPRSGTHLVTT